MKKASTESRLSIGDGDGDDVAIVLRYYQLNLVTFLSP